MRNTCRLKYNFIHIKLIWPATSCKETAKVGLHQGISISKSRRTQAQQDMLILSQPLIRNFSNKSANYQHLIILLGLRISAWEVAFSSWIFWITRIEGPRERNQERHPTSVIWNEWYGRKRINEKVAILARVLKNTLHLVVSRCQRWRWGRQL